MKAGAATAAVLVIVACGQQTVGGTPTNNARSAVASGERSTGGQSSSPSVLNSPHALSGAYGIQLASLGAGQNTQLDLITSNGSVAASVSVAQPSISGQACGQGMGAWFEPPVSSSNDAVYYRDGDNKIRMVVPPSSYSEVTTVPGGPDLVSSFSVSPDDQRIAVLVEDLSAPNTIAEKLYVEDLHGGGHHSDIYTTTTPKGKGATTLWPMGWHRGQLVLGLWVACTFQEVPFPIAWHVVNASTALRQASVGDNSCLPGAWPSPAGTACFRYSSGQVDIYDWSGTRTSSLTNDVGTNELSPSGDLLFAGLTGPDSYTTIAPVSGGPSITVPGRVACEWIDDSHLLAYDSVISYPSGDIKPLAQQGVCAGRFPGGL